MNVTDTRVASSGYITEHRYIVEADGTVRILDEVAGHYTLCHHMSEAAQCRIRRMAVAAAAV